MMVARRGVVAFATGWLVLFALSVTSATADVPTTIHFQGRLTTASGASVPDAASQSLTFRLFNAPTGGTPLWSETQNNVRVTSGAFSVDLNLATGYSGTNTLASVLAGTPYLEIQAGTDPPMTPRQAFSATPYALQAASVPDGSITNASLAPTVQQSVGLLGADGGLIARGTADAAAASKRSIAVSGAYAYVTEFAANTLAVVDVSDPDHPTSVGAAVTNDGPQSVAVAGSYAYVVNNTVSRLEVFNISNPASPALVGANYTAGDPMDVAVSGTHAYVVNNFARTLQVFDVSDPTAPIPVGSAPIADRGWAVAISGHHAYVVNFDGGLQVFDIANPVAPTLTGSVRAGLGLYDIAVSSGYAYIADYSGKALKVVNVANPAAPTVVKSIPIADAPLCVSISGRKVVVGAFKKTIQLFDAADPAAPALVSTKPASHEVDGIASQGNFAYAAPYDSRVQVFQLATTYGSLDEVRFGDGTVQTSAALMPGSPAGGDLTGTYPNPRIAPGAVTADKVAAGTIQVGNLSNAIQASLTTLVNVGPTLIGESTGISQAQAVAVSGHYAYVADMAADKLVVVDISQPANPATVGSVATGDHPSCVAVQGGYAYVVNLNAGNVQVFNVGNPTTPTIVSTIGGIGPVAIAVQGQYAYIGGGPGNAFYIYDISSPAAPVRKCAITISGADSVAIQGNYAYLAGHVPTGGALKVLDVSDPTAPVLKGTVATASSPMAVAVSGGIACVANAPAQNLQVIDVSNPSAPAVISSVATPTYAYGVVLNGYIACVVSGVGNGYFQAVDLSNPAAPVSLGTINVAGNPRGAALDGNLAYIAANAGPMQVVRVIDNAIRFGDGTIQRTAAGSTGGPVNTEMSGLTSAGYADMIPALVKAVKALKADNDGKAAQISALHRQVSAQRGKSAAIEARLKRLEDAIGQQR